MGLVEQTLSQERQDIHKKIGGRIIQEQEVKYALSLEENIQLRKQLEKKLLEKERIDFKHAQAKSSFIEIMRELTRFRREFNEIHSLRSKLILTNAICKDVTSMIKNNEQTITMDQAELDSFSSKKSRLTMRRQCTMSYVNNSHDKLMQQLQNIKNMA